MKEVITTDRVKQSNQVRALVEQSNRILDEVVGSSGPGVTAVWDQEEDGNGRRQVVLKLRDWTGEVTTRLAPEDLKNPAQMRWRLYGLWGDLLQIRSHKQLEELQKAEGG